MPIASPRTAHLALFKLCKTLFVEPNPVPIKSAMMMCGLLSNDTVRLPLVSSSDETKAALKKVFVEAGLLSE